MPFKDASAMDQKVEFVKQAALGEEPMSLLCERFGIGRTSGYKYLARWRASGEAGLVEHSRRPQLSPKRTPAAAEAAVLALRAAHPVWGGRKIACRLRREGYGPMAASTVTDILRRGGVELGRHGGGAKPFQRFEHAHPNDLWQMDFKGHVPLAGPLCAPAGRLHPLTVLDDHSRYSILLAACADERTWTVKAHLTNAFRRYGLPRTMIMDNGSPWGDRQGQPFTLLTVWLIEQDIRVSHARPRHPQTIGKDERFHRTLALEALSGPPFGSIGEAQNALDRWRDIYNCQRPHEAIDLAMPSERYTPSPRPYRETVEPFAYQPGDILRRVQDKGRASLGGRTVKLPKSFRGKAVAFRQTQIDGLFEAWFRHHKITDVDLRQNTE